MGGRTYDQLSALATELAEKRAAIIVADGGDPPALASKRQQLRFRWYS